MENKQFRLHGRSPYTVVCVHGGPGAPGSVARLSVELSGKRGVVEPFQTGKSIPEQITELKHILAKAAKLPVVLIGHSWGAWLSYLFTAENPEIIRKLILVSAGPFKTDYVPAMMKTRKNRLHVRERTRLDELLYSLERGNNRNDSSLMSELGELMEKTDNYELLKLPELELNNLEILLDLDPGIFTGIMSEASEMRRSGALLDAGRRIKCPVAAIHGDHDPHPAAGVREPLRKIIKDFRFFLLEKCGHEPWREKYAREEFYRIMNKELADSFG